VIAQTNVTIASEHAEKEPADEPSNFTVTADEIN
jgi:hypothetical protein